MSAVPSRDRKSVYVGGLPITATDAELRELFGKYGGIREISNKCMQGFAFLHFYDESAVAKLLVEPEIRMHGQLLKVDATHFGVSSRDFKKMQLEAEDEEKAKKLEETKDETYVVEETEEEEELRLRREAASKAKAEELQRRREEYEAMHGKPDETMEVDEMPVIKKRTPVKRDSEEHGKAVVKKEDTRKEFTFTEPSEGVVVTIRESFHGGAQYTVQGFTKPVFTKVEFNEDDDGDFIDFDELDTSLSVPHASIAPLAAFFTSIGIKHNHTEPAPTPVPSQGVQPDIPAAPYPSSGRGRGRGRGRGQAA